MDVLSWPDSFALVGVCWAVAFVYWTWKTYE